MALPADYLDALGKLATAFAAYEASTGRSAVLVGGGAAALHTAGAFMSSDFDIVAGDDEAFAGAMAEAGFRSEDVKAVHGCGSWYHPDAPQYGIEQVSGGYFDGRADKARCIRIAVADGAIVLPAVEDLIADRLGQHEVAGGDTAMLEQARALFTIAQGLDVTYLIQRIVEEGGNPEHLELSRG